MAFYHVIMADVVKSSSLDQVQLGSDLQQLVQSCNEHLAGVLLSPLTVTLGDEFQGVASSLEGAIESLFTLEEMLLEKAYPFRLRYVVLYGEIRTEINPEIAYGMLGPGLTAARARLVSKERSRPRFQFKLGDDVATTMLESLFRLLELLVQEWKSKDSLLISELITQRSIKEVAERLEKDRSLIWKRRKSLRIEEYLILKELVNTTVNSFARGL